MSWSDTLSCAICGFEADSNLITHIIKRHNITIAEYKLLYPAKVVFRFSDAVKQKMSDDRRDYNSVYRKNIAAKEAKENRCWTDKIVCKICGFETASSIVSHINRRHNITGKEYKLKYPNCIIQRTATEDREKASKNAKEKFKDPTVRAAFLDWRSFPSEIKHWVRKGFSFDEAKECVKEFQTKASLCQNNKPETLNARSEAMLGDKNPMSLVSIAIRAGVSIDEAVKLTPCYGRTNEKHPMFGKHHTADVKEQIAANMPKAFYNRSFGEIELQNVLKEQFCDELIETNIRVLTYNCDIVFPVKRVIVEYMGEFWHPHADAFSPTWVHPRTKLTAKQMWEHDNLKLKALTDAGYNVIVVRGKDWCYRRSEVIFEVKNAINQP